MPLLNDTQTLILATRQVRRGVVVRGIPVEQVLEVFTVWGRIALTRGAF